MNQDKKPHWTSSKGKFHSGKISYYICVSVNCMCAWSHVCNCRRICHGCRVEVRVQPWALGLGFHLVWNGVSSFLFSWCTPGSRGSPACPSHPAVGAPRLHSQITKTSFSMGRRDLNIGPHISTANALPTAEPSQPSGSILSPVWNIIIYD